MIHVSSHSAPYVPEPVRYSFLPSCILDSFFSRNFKIIVEIMYMKIAVKMAMIELNLYISRMVVKNPSKHPPTALPQ